MIQPNKKVICLDDLSASERILLAQDLWDSVPDEETAWQPSPALLAELDRRNAAYAADGNPGLTWEEAKARLRSGT